MRRREVVLGTACMLAGAAGSRVRPATARDRTGPRHIAVVAGAAAGSNSPYFRAFADELRRLGYSGQDSLRIDYLKRSPDAQELTRKIVETIREGAEIIVANGPEEALRAAMSATREQPIVMIAVDYDPLAKGYIGSLSHPGGNVTGVFFRQIELAQKRVELLREAVPDARRMPLLWDTHSADQYAAVRETLEGSGIPAVSVECREPPYDYEALIGQAGLTPGEALLVMTSPAFFADRDRLSVVTRQKQLATMFGLREWVNAGGLMSYGASIAEMTRLAAYYVDKLLNGARPADLPVIQPTKLELVINLNTAKTLGLTISQPLLARADEVIE
jgi:putative tryptophan/tyrosine transport system substrate-binding protein